MLMNRSLKRKPTLPLSMLVTYWRTALSPPAAVCSSRKDLSPATDSLENKVRKVTKSRRRDIVASECLNINKRTLLALFTEALLSLRLFDTKV